MVTIPKDPDIDPMGLALAFLAAIVLFVGFKLSANFLGPDTMRGVVRGVVCVLILLDAIAGISLYFPRTARS